VSLFSEYADDLLYVLNTDFLLLKIGLWIITHYSAQPIVQLVFSV